METRVKNVILGVILVMLMTVSIGFGDLPVVQGCSVEVYAELEVPTRICFTPDGVMYAGNRSNFSGANSIYRIEPGGGTGSVSLYGPPLYKAGTVGYDRDGLISKNAGSVLVVGGMYSQTHFTAILPDETTQLLWTGPFVNGGDIAFDSTGRMLFVDVESRNVYWNDEGTLEAI